MKRITGILLSVMLIVSMMPSMAVFADQPAVTYLKADGTTATITDYQIMPECSGRAEPTEIVARTYVVNRSNDRDTASALKLKGNATIIIKKGCTLYAHGINLNNYKLTVYAENNLSGFAKACELQVPGGYEGSAICNGTLEINSGKCYLTGGEKDGLGSGKPWTALDTLSADSNLIVNNGRVTLQGCSVGRHEGDRNSHIVESIAGYVRAGQGIVINNCISFNAFGGHTFSSDAVPGTFKDTGHLKAFLTDDIGKVTLNGDYIIEGSNFNLSTQQYDDSVSIQKNEFSTKMVEYDDIYITSTNNPAYQDEDPDDGGGGGTGSGSGGGGAGGSEEITPENKAAGVDVSNSVSVSTQNGKTVASVDVSDKVNDLVKNAADSKAKEVTINAKSSANVDKVDVTIPADTFAQLAKIDSLNDAVISTGVCDFAIDKQALAEIAKQAPAGSKLTIEAVESPTSSKSATVYELKITAGNKKISSFNGGKIMITVDIPPELKGQPAACIYKNEKGIYSSVQTSNVVGDNAKLSFVTQHFSTYIVMSEVEATKLLAKQAKPKFKSVKALKGKKIAVSFKKPSLGNASTDAVKYTVQRSTNSKFKKAVKNFTVKSNDSVVKYTDSKKLKKGTKYYYRVRATVLLANGSKANSKWSAVKSAKCK